METQFDEILQFMEIFPTVFARIDGGKQYIVRTLMVPNGRYISMLDEIDQRGGEHRVCHGMGSTIHEAVLSAWGRRNGVTR